MSVLLGSEPWRGEVRPNALLYLTCACDPSWIDAPEGASAAFREATRALLTRERGSLWAGRGEPPAEWPFGALHGDGEDRLAAQFFKVNHRPADRYTRSPPGSASARIAPGRTGLDNLEVAGDWTGGTLDAGCVEAAVTSGIMASEALRERIGASDGVRCSRYGAR